ncbi:uncharacterized protein LOC101848717, partial [Aplysia californica]|uniref:Uncharacterized protein LOC101848717 n=1 Tax=Aplysia californica TaxID=6500 RepID=A0ABM1AEK2_APLCA
MHGLKIAGYVIVAGYALSAALQIYLLFHAMNLAYISWDRKCNPPSTSEPGGPLMLHVYGPYGRLATAPRPTHHNGLTFSCSVANVTSLDGLAGATLGGGGEGQVGGQSGGHSDLSPLDTQLYDLPRGSPVHTELYDDLPRESTTNRELYDDLLRESTTNTELYDDLLRDPTTNRELTDDPQETPVDRDTQTPTTSGPTDPLHPPNDRAAQDKVREVSHTDVSPSRILLSSRDRYKPPQHHRRPTGDRSKADDSNPDPSPSQPPAEKTDLGSLDPDTVQSICADVENLSYVYAFSESNDSVSFICCKALFRHAHSDTHDGHPSTSDHPMTSDVGSHGRLPTDTSRGQELRPPAALSVLLTSRETGGAHGELQLTLDSDLVPPGDVMPPGREDCRYKVAEDNVYPLSIIAQVVAILGIIMCALCVHALLSGETYMPCVLAVFTVVTAVCGLLSAAGFAKSSLGMFLWSWQFYVYVIDYFFVLFAAIPVLLCNLLVRAAIARYQRPQFTEEAPVVHRRDLKPDHEDGTDDEEDDETDDDETDDDDDDDSDDDDSDDEDSDDDDSDDDS